MPLCGAQSGGGNALISVSLIESVDDILPDGWFVPMMVFDYFIGNSDRHQSNWAIQRLEGMEYRLCPLYDNGSSLCSYIAEKDVDKYLGNDKLRFYALVNSKSRSRIRIDGHKKKEPTHSDVMVFLLEKYAETKVCTRDFVDILSEEKIKELLSEYPSQLLSERKKYLIEKFLLAKRDELFRLLEGIEHG